MSPALNALVSAKEYINIEHVNLFIPYWTKIYGLRVYNSTVEQIIHHNKLIISIYRKMGQHTQF